MTMPNDEHGLGLTLEEFFERYDVPEADRERIRQETEPALVEAFRQWLRGSKRDDVVVH